VARLLVRAADKDPGGPIDPDVYVREYAHKGDIVAVRPNGWEWGTAELLPERVSIDIPGGHKAARLYEGPWNRQVSCSHIVTNPATDTIKLDVDVTTPVRADGLGGFKPGEFDAMFADWNMAPTIASEKISLTAVVWDVVRSQGFNGSAPIEVLTFSETFNAPLHRAAIGYPAGFHPNTIAANVMAKGGDIVSNQNGELVVEFTADDVIAVLAGHLTHDVDNRVQKRRYQIDSATVDAAIAAGGSLSLNGAQFNAALVDKGL